MARAFARPYNEVAQRLLEWQDEGYVDVDQSPALYLHEYTVTGMTIRGIVGTLDLSTRALNDAERTVYAHEGIHAEQTAELATRMFEMGVNPAPILLVHHGTQALRQMLDTVSSRAPQHEYEDRSGQLNRLWRIEDAEEIAVVTHQLSATQLMIADGHHRYAAYLRLQEQNPGTPWDRGLVMVVDQDDTPFFLGAIHRTFPGVTLTALSDALRSIGAEVTAVSPDGGISALNASSWVATDGTSWIQVRVEANRSPVEHLHLDVVPRLQGAAGVAHHHTVDEALQHAGVGQVAVLLPAPGYDLLDRAMDEGRLLPEKATSFQPKPNIGVLMRSADSELLPTR
ncbi:DUF1015 family protein [Nocardioides yefusunii]|uniref:DUF1015 family protein n=1 Tax=Nocardioides yefusunii TaxID=2500546 RepID=A0ABW1QYI1_9ACTN